MIPDDPTYSQVVVSISTVTEVVLYAILLIVIVGLAMFVGYGIRKHGGKRPDCYGFDSRGNHDPSEAHHRAEGLELGSAS